MIPIEELRQRLQTAFPEELVVLENPMNDGKHYQVTVVSTQFEGQNIVAQHQRVYRALGDAMQGAVHALAIQTFTPQAWKARQQP